jgi:predicted metal-dependent enzyme (double-stranded beta helix superfamily)
VWNSLLRSMDSIADAGASNVEQVTELMHRLTPDVLQIDCDPEVELPWGRYLVHADPGGRYNLQLDVFSRDYHGQVHAHDTWGVFWVLQGALRVTDYELVDGAARAQRSARITAGGAQCFCPPVSDWHRVATPADGLQTVSLHLYGPGFDLHTGRSVAEGGPVAYRRGPFGELARVAPALRLKAASAGPR